MIVLLVLLVLWAVPVSAASLQIPIQTNAGPGVLTDCHDGDTCTINIPTLPDLFGKHLSLRLIGIDTPEMRGECPEERRLAGEARDVLLGLIRKATQVQVELVGRDKYFRALATIRADGKDLADELKARKLAKPYDGGTKEPWCS